MYRYSAIKNIAFSCAQKTAVVRWRIEIVHCTILAAPCGPCLTAGPGDAKGVAVDDLRASRGGSTPKTDGPLAKALALPVQMA